MEMLIINSNEVVYVVSSKEIRDIERLRNKVLLFTIEEKITSMNDLI